MKDTADVRFQTGHDTPRARHAYTRYLIFECFRQVGTAYRHHKDMQRLRDMPDYLLRDVGIERSTVEATGFFASLFRDGSHR
ncbi:MAG: hypothetical protein AAGA28_17265 [Pseudomonadota bacterium]